MESPDAQFAGGVRVGAVIVDEKGFRGAETLFPEYGEVDLRGGFAQVYLIGPETAVEITFEGSPCGIAAVEPVDETSPVGQVGVAEQEYASSFGTQAVEQFEPPPVVRQQHGVPGIEQLRGSRDGISVGNERLQLFDELPFRDLSEFEPQEYPGVAGMGIERIEAGEAQGRESGDCAADVDVEQYAAEIENKIPDSVGHSGFLWHGRGGRFGYSGVKVYFCTRILRPRIRGRQRRAYSSVG